MKQDNSNMKDKNISIDRFIDTICLRLYLRLILYQGFDNNTINQIDAPILRLNKAFTRYFATQLSL